MTREVVLDNADEVIVYKVTYNKELNRYTVYTVTSATQGRKHPHLHTCTIEAEDPNYRVGGTYNGQLITDPKQCPLSKATGVLVSCNCEDFEYRLEVANNNISLSPIIFSNGQAPVKTNPGEVPGVCKHLLKAIIFLLQRDL